jgi:hypothetical protein
MRSPPRPSWLLALLAAIAASGCATSSLSRRSPVELPGASRCRVGSGRTDLLVTEWPASEKANLESMARFGAVAVEYSGCTMRVLTGCRLVGRYLWQRTTPASDQLQIEGIDELYAKLPLGAASLEGELKSTGTLTVDTRVSGQLRLDGFGASEVPPYGDCARATHVVGALAVGAFALEGKNAATASADVAVAKASLGGKAERSAGLIRSAGDWKACDDGTEDGPAPNCRSPIEVFLWPIPGRAPEEGPAGTVRVDLLSATANARWDVYYDDQVICTTPCSRYLDPARPIFLRTREDGPGGPDRIRVRDVLDAAGDGAVQVQAHPTSYGKLATGITFTTFGGMAVVTGVSLAAIGCSGGQTASSGMCTAGGTTLAIGSLLTAGAIWLITDSLPRADLVPGGSPSPAHPGRGFAMSVGPGGISGRF